MPDSKHGLKRGLASRHVQLIALGGAVGTGLFLGLASVVKMAGPSVILGYAFVGIIAYFIMRQLGEMMVQEPVAGSFSNLANKYCGGFAGFLSGWNYWVLYVLVSMAELTAAAVYVKFWFPEIPQWAVVVAFFLVINAINLMTVKIFGETEFWFALIKVLAVIGIIILGAYLLASGKGGPEASITNLWAVEGFFPKGFWGFFTALAVISFSFGGLELVGIAAAETSNPQKNIPRAINQVLVRILIFYVGALVVLLSLCAWNKIVPMPDGTPPLEAMVASPFVQIFSNLGIPSVANIMNFVVLTAALSVYNSGVYCNSRMLFGLALQGNAPKIFTRLSAGGVPVASILVSSGATILCVIVNAYAPEEAMGKLMMLVVASLIINWALITFTHLKFRIANVASGTNLLFRSLGYPITNILCFVFYLAIFYILWEIGMKLVVYITPLWMLLLGLIYFIKEKSKKVVA